LEISKFFASRSHSLYTVVCFYGARLQTKVVKFTALASASWVAL